MGETKGPDPDPPWKPIAADVYEYWSVERNAKRDKFVAPIS